MKTYTKHSKKGFSLAELLIAIAIISILVTIGVTTSRKGIEKAFDGYIYTGYEGITTAIAEAATDGYKLTPANIASEPEAGKSNFTTEIIRMFEVDDSKITRDTANNIIDFTAPNGIEYKISHSGTNGTKNYYNIRIKFPTANIRTPNERKYADFIYAPNDNYGLLIPLPTPNPKVNEEFGGTYLTDLMTNYELLAFYPDNGRAGRMLWDNNEQKRVYQKREITSLNDCLCVVANDGDANTTDEPYINFDSTNGILTRGAEHTNSSINNCGNLGITFRDSYDNGAIQMVNPR